MERKMLRAKLADLLCSDCKLKNDCSILNYYCPAFQRLLKIYDIINNIMESDE